MPYHNTLEKQIAQTLQPAQLADPQITALLKMVNESYHALDNRLPTAAEATLSDSNEFLSVMSRSIRTPLNAIIGIAHLLLQERLPPPHCDHLKVLNISAENLLNLVNDILDFGKIEEGKISLAQNNVDLRQLAGYIKMAHQQRAEENGNLLKMVIDPAIPHFVTGDDVRLGQVLHNLVSNAVKFTRNGTVTIDLRLEEIAGDKVSIRFTVSDTGIGIEKDRQPLIFDRFIQANTDTSYQSGGSGLGLAIVKKLLQLHNSDIQLHSEPNHGSTFVFTIDFTKGRVDLHTDATFVNNSNNLKDINILLVEDVAFNVLVAEKMLTNWQANVQVASNGLVAVGKVREERYDIVLMDLQMPVMDGFNATRHIRDFNPDIPIIALTASTSSDIRQKAHIYGMNDSLLKPFKPDELFNIIYKYAHA